MSVVQVDGRALPSLRSVGQSACLKSVQAPAYHTGQTRASAVSAVGASLSSAISAKDGWCRSVAILSSTQSQLGQVSVAQLASAQLLQQYYHLCHASTVQFFRIFLCRVENVVLSINLLPNLQDVTQIFFIHLIRKSCQFFEKSVYFLFTIGCQFRQHEKVVILHLYFFFQIFPIFF